MRLVQQIEISNHRLVHLTDDVQATFLDERNKLKSDRDTMKEQISQTKSLWQKHAKYFRSNVEKTEVATDGQA